MDELNQSLDALDRALIKELENDPLASNTELGARLFASRNTIARRIQQLQDQQIITVSIIRHKAELGYRTMAFFFISVDEGKAKRVAKTLSAHPLIEQVNTSTGQYDIMAFGRFRDNYDLLDFLRNELGGIPEVVSYQTIIALTTAKSYYPLIEQGKAPAAKGEPSISTDELELQIIDELEKDPRRSQTDMARQLGVVRHTVSKKIKDLLNNQVISIVTYASPSALGYRTTSVILLRVRPRSLDLVAKRLATFQEIQDVIIGTGHCDIVAFAVVRDNKELQALVQDRIGTVPGVLGQETVVISSGVKSPFGLQE